MDTIEAFKKQTAYIDKGTEEITANLNHIMTHNNHTLMSKDQPEDIQKYEQETKILKEGLDHLIKLLTKGSAEQQKLLGECQMALKETTELTNKFVELFPTNALDVPNDDNLIVATNLNKDESICKNGSEPMNYSIDEITSGYDLLNTSLPKLL